MRRLLAGLLVVLVAGFSASLAHAGTANTTFDGPAFSLTAKELRAAADKAPREKDDAVITLFDETTYVVQAKLVTEKRFRRIYLITDEHEAAEWSDISSGWAPWLQSAPTIRARVLTQGGKFYDLDPSTVETPQPSQGDSHTYSDWRSLRAPLPAIRNGSVVEWEVIVKQHASLLPGGDSEMRSLGAYVPVLQSRVTVEYPANDKPNFRISLPTGASRKTTRGKQTHREIFDVGHLAPYDIEGYLPTRLPRTGYVSFSTYASWNQIVVAYAKIIDGAIVSGPLPANIGSKKGATRAETVANAVAYLHQHIRYTGLEFGHNAIVPWSPATTWSRQFGDCKDKATALIALLRSHAIEAHPALLSSDYGFDDGTRVAGLDRFDHVIVYIPPANKTESPVWIDPTVDLARAGQLPASVQGRWALVAANGQTRLTRIPVETADQNRVVEVRKVVLPQRGSASLVETSTYYGQQEVNARYEYRGKTGADLKETFAMYAKDHYVAESIDRVDLSKDGDISTIYQQALHFDRIGVGFTDFGSAMLNLNFYQLNSLLPPELLSYINATEDARKEMMPRVGPLSVTPSSKAWTYEIHLPTGFILSKPLAAVNKKFGPITFSQQSSWKKNLYQIQFGFRVEGGELKAKEFNRIRVELAKFMKETAISLHFENEAITLSGEGKHVEASREIQRQLKDAPLDPVLRAFEIYILTNAGLGNEANVRAAVLVKAHPTSTLAWEVRGIAAMHNKFGVFQGSGWDRAAAIAALKKATALSPHTAFIHGRLGILLSRDAQGQPSLKDANAAIGSLTKAQPAGESEYDLVLARLLFAKGLYDELEKLLATHDGTPEFESLRLVVVAKRNPKGLAAAAALVDDNTSHLAFLHTIALLDYSLAATLLPYSRAKLVPGSAEIGKSIVRFVPNPGAKTPIEVAREALGAMLTRDKSKFDSLLSSRGKLHGFAKAEDLDAAFLSQLPRDARSLLEPVTADIFTGLAEFKEMNRAGPLTRLSVHSLGSVTGIAVFTVQENKRHRILASGEGPAALASEIISLVRSKRLNAAKVAIEWLIQIDKALPDASVSNFVSILWQAPGLKEDQRILLTAAQFLLSGPEAAVASEILETCPTTGSDPLIQVCLRSRIRALTGKGDPDAALALYHANKDRWPAKADAFLLDAILAASRSKTPEATSAPLIAARKALHPKDPAYWLWNEAMVLGIAGKFDEIYDLLLKHPDAYEDVGIALNNAAWIGLFATGRLEHAVKLAEQAVAKAEVNERSYALHTLATIHAARGDIQNALDTWRDAGVYHRLRGNDGTHWLIYGQIAEQLGYKDAALGAYALVTSGPDETYAITTTDLAKRWAKALKAAL